MKDGEVITPDAFGELPAEQQQKIEKAITALQERLAQLLRDTQRWRKEHRERVRQLNREVASFAVGREMEDLRQAYADLPDVVAYLAAVEHDLVENIDDFRRGPETPSSPLPFVMPDGQAPNFRRYQVNLLLDRSEHEGVPVVHEDLPTHPNLLGRVEHVAQLGALVTDFTLIKAGALHRANGGYLLLDVLKLLSQPFAWEGLKRALTTRRIRIESLGQMYSFVSTISLEPEPIPLEVKVVLFGERHWYYLLYAYDPDFAELFKVAVDFDDEVPRTHDNQAAARAADRDRRAAPGDAAVRPRRVARLIEHARARGRGQRAAVDARAGPDRRDDRVRLRARGAPAPQRVRPDDVDAAIAARPRARRAHRARDARGGPARARC